MYKNSEGYPDPTAGKAMSRMMKEYREFQRQRFADKNRKKIYVASKYGGDIGANVIAAISYCRYIIEAGHMPIASHLLYPQILDDAIPRERELGLMFGLALLAICNEIWVFGEVSAGMEQEIREARKLGIPVRYVEEVTE